MKSKFSDFIKAEKPEPEELSKIDKIKGAFLPHRKHSFLDCIAQVSFTKEKGKILSIDYKIVDCQIILYGENSFRIDLIIERKVQEMVTRTHTKTLKEDKSIEYTTQQSSLQILGKFHDSGRVDPKDWGFVSAIDGKEVIGVCIAAKFV